jgi:hypothetical protein
MSTNTPALAQCSDLIFKQQ